MDEIILLNELEHVEELENRPDRDDWSKWHEGSPFDLISDRQFVKMFRLPKQLVLNLIEMLDNYISPPSRLSALPKSIKVCDANMRILNVNARYPGSTHDAYVWRNSNLNLHMQELNVDHPRYFLIGDSGYPLRRWLQTPIRNPEPASPEEAYNTTFCQARSTIERCNGLLKMRFRCLLKQRVLHYSPTVAAKIINACVVLHNICISQNLPDPEAEEGDRQLDFGIIEENNLERVDIAGRNIDLENGRQLQRQIIQNHFANR